MLAAAPAPEDFFVAGAHLLQADRMRAADVWALPTPNMAHFRLSLCANDGLWMDALLAQQRQDGVEGVVDDVG